MLGCGKLFVISVQPFGVFEVVTALGAPDTIEIYSIINLHATLWRFSQLIASRTRFG
jgi:hypothetical protein